MNRAHYDLRLIDAVIVIVAYSASLASRTLDPMVAGHGAHWADLAVALPFVVAIHLVINGLVGTYARRAGRTMAVVVAGVSLIVLFVLNILVRVESGLVVGYSVLVVGSASTVVLMPVTRLVSRPLLRRGPTPGLKQPG